MKNTKRIVKKVCILKTVKKENREILERWMDVRIIVMCCEIARCETTQRRTEDDFVWPGLAVHVVFPVEHS